MTNITRKTRPTLKMTDHAVRLRWNASAHVTLQRLVEIGHATTGRDKVRAIAREETHHIRIPDQDIQAENRKVTKVHYTVSNFPPS